VDNSIFISYRRSVSAFIARAVFQDLRSNNYDVFMDVESIHAGEMDTIILNQIGARPYFLLILAPGSLDRCDEPDDWLRREIEYAMDLKRIIIPLTTSNFEFDSAKHHLTGKLEDLHRFQAVSVPHDYFDAAMDRLRNRFLRPINVPIIPASPEERATVQRKIEQAAAEPPVTERQLSAQDHFERGLLAFMKGDQQNAIIDYRKAIKLDRDFAEAHAAIGLVFRDLEQTTNAIESFHTALDLQPDHPLAEEMREYIDRQRERLRKITSTRP
jgi:tetratricopeptide (TPR) repeat protein